MSIQSAIEALSPLQYYRLQELTGTIAHDTGSAGVNGVFDSGVLLGLPGPESGTYAVQFLRDFLMRAPVATPSTGSQTVLWWAATLVRTTQAALGGVGDISSIPAAGFSFQSNNIVSNGFQGSGAGIGRRSTRFNFTVSALPDAQWHMQTVTFNPTEGFRFYQDGVLTDGPSGVDTINIPGVSSKVWIGGDRTMSSQVAHLAVWNSQLTPTQILAVYNARAGPQQIAYQAGQFSSANNNIYGTAGDPNATLTAIYASQAGISSQVSDVATNVGLLSLAVDVVRTTTNSIFTWVSGWPDAATSIANWLAPKVNDVLSRLNVGFPSPISGLTPGTPHTLTGTGNLVSTGRALRVESFVVPPGWGHYDAAIQQWVPRIAAITLMAPDASSNLVPIADIDVTYDPTVVTYQGTLPSRIYYWVAPGCTIVLTELL